VLSLTVHLQYFIQHGFHVMLLNFGARYHFTFIDCMFYDVHHNKNNNNINVLFTVCVADLY